MKKRLLYINLFVLIVFNCQAQAYSLLKTIQVNANTIEVDPFGNIYAVQENKITKYSENGELLYVFNEIENGVITSLDVSNPLKPLVFYKDFSNLQILDQKLSLVNTINLTARNFDFIETLANANGDNYWIYDNLSNSLKKLSKSLNLVYESESFLSLFTESLIPLKIIETEQTIFILDDEGVHLFDNFANYKKTIKISHLTDFQVLGGKLIYLNGNDLLSYDLKTLQIELLKTPKSEGFKSAKIFKNKILLHEKNKIHIYSMK